MATCIKSFSAVANAIAAVATVVGSMMNLPIPIAEWGRLLLYTVAKRWNRVPKVS